MPSPPNVAILSNALDFTTSTCTKWTKSVSNIHAFITDILVQFQCLRIYGSDIVCFLTLFFCFSPFFFASMVQFQNSLFILLFLNRLNGHKLCRFLSIPVNINFKLWLKEAHHELKKKQKRRKKIRAPPDCTTKTLFRVVYFRLCMDVRCWYIRCNLVYYST